VFNCDDFGDLLGEKDKGTTRVNDADRAEVAVEDQNLRV
jgi:hypothetical protein